MNLNYFRSLMWVKSILFFCIWLFHSTSCFQNPCTLIHNENFFAKSDWYSHVCHPCSSIYPSLAMWVVSAIEVLCMILIQKLVCLSSCFQFFRNMHTQIILCCLGHLGVVLLEIPILVMICDVNSWLLTSGINQNPSGWVYLRGNFVFFISHLKCKDPPLLWVIASVKDMEEGILLSLPACPGSSWQVHFFIGIRAYFFKIHVLQTSWDIQLHRLNNCWVLGLCSYGQPLLD